MLQVVDSIQARRRWIGLLARAPLDLLEAWAQQHSAGYTWLRRPETGLVMVRGRAGGGGAKFNLGEMTVTRCALRVGSGASGVAYVQGRSHRKAELAALADARLQDGCAETRALLERVRARLDAEAQRMARKAQATRVEFFTLAREAGE